VVGILTKDEEFVIQNGRGKPKEKVQREVENFHFSAHKNSCDPI
jgi:hypothetical protein